MNLRCSARKSRRRRSRSSLPRSRTSSRKLRKKAKAFDARQLQERNELQKLRSNLSGDAATNPATQEFKRKLREIAEIPGWARKILAKTVLVKSRLPELAQEELTIVGEDYDPKRPMSRYDRMKLKKWEPIIEKELVNELSFLARSSSLQ